MGIMGVTSQCKREVRAEERVAMLVVVSYIRKKRGDVEGGRWRWERRLMETTATRNEILEERPAMCPMHLCDVFQAETAINLDFRGVWKWADFVCDAPCTMGEEARSQGLLEHEDKNQVGVLE